MFQPKWYNSDRDLKKEDLVYFQKKEGKVDYRESGAGDEVRSGWSYQKSNCPLSESG